MAVIEGIRIRNFRALRDVTLGKLWNGGNRAPLSPITVVVGHNGAGKSSIFEAFGFLSDCLKYGVEEACDRNRRGGYDKLHSKGQSGPIQFEIYYRESPSQRPITYELSIDKDKTGRPYVCEERLRQRRAGQSWGRPFSFLWLVNGSGFVWKGEYTATEQQEDSLSNNRAIEESNEVEHIQLSDTRRLGIATLGVLKQHPRVIAFRNFFMGWYLSYFSPNSARELPMAGAQSHLSSSGDNLGNVVQYMEREYGARFKTILQQIAHCIPGISDITTQRTADDRLLLCFHSRGFDAPFYAQQMSDGTLKLFAYLLLMNDPQPHPFVCIEEPENGLYNQLFATFVTELRKHATGRKQGFQAFITTHQPYLVDALQPEEVWVLQKGDDGFSTVIRASDNATVKALCEQELPLGSLWYSNYLDD